MYYKIIAFILITIFSIVTNVYYMDLDPEAFVLLMAEGVITSFILGLIFCISLFFYKENKKPIIIQICLFAVSINAIVTMLTYQYFQTRVNNLNEIENKRPISKMILQRETYLMPPISDKNVLQKKLETQSMKWLREKGYNVKTIDVIIRPPYYYKRYNQFDIKKENKGFAALYFEVLKSPSGKKQLTSIDMDFDYYNGILELKNVSRWEDGKEINIPDLN